jgi:uncharacterized protein YndB with AHSA1/START domain
MEDIRDEIVLRAPVERVWKAIEDPATHAQWHPFLKHVAGEHVLGAIRKCDVLVGKKAATTEERCSTYDESRKIMWTIEQDTSGFSRMVSDWSAGFSLEAKGSDETRVVAQSAFTLTKLISRLMLPMIRRKFHQTQQSILGGLKQHVEEPPHAHD